MPVFNGEKFIADAIQSVLEQSYPTFELLICNDGSDDNTESIIQSFDDKRIVVIKHSQRLGIPASRNELLEKSRGSLVAWLDADDIANPDRIEIQVQFLSDNPLCSVCFSDVVVFDEHHCYSTHFPNNPKLLKHVLFFKQPVFFSSCMARKYEGICFDLFLKRIQDFDYLWKLVQKGSPEIIRKPLAKYRLVHSSYKPDFDHHTQEQLYVQKQKLQSLDIHCQDEQILSLNKFLRDIRLCDKKEINEALNLLQLVYQSNKINVLGLNKKYLKALYSYQVLKACYYHSIVYLTKFKWADIETIRDLIKMRM